jgi:hypothetical protein
MTIILQRPIQGNIFPGCLEKKVILVWYWIESSPERFSEPITEVNVWADGRECCRLCNF